MPRRTINLDSKKKKKKKKKGVHDWEFISERVRGITTRTLTMSATYVFTVDWVNDPMLQSGIGMTWCISIWIVSLSASWRHGQFSRRNSLAISKDRNKSKVIFRHREFEYIPSLFEVVSGVETSKSTLGSSCWKLTWKSWPRHWKDTQEQGQPRYKG